MVVVMNKLTNVKGGIAAQTTVRIHAVAQNNH